MSNGKKIEVKSMQSSYENLRRIIYLQLKVVVVILSHANAHKTGEGGGRG
jgi:hypothetical protein